MKQIIKSLFESRRSVIRAACVAGLMLGGAARQTEATNFTWTNISNSNNYYEVAGNWSPMGTPGAADAILFNSGATYNVIIDEITGNRTVQYMDVWNGNMSLQGTGPQILTVTSQFSTAFGGTLNINGLQLNSTGSALMLNGSTINVIGLPSSFYQSGGQMDLRHGTLRFQNSATGVFLGGIQMNFGFSPQANLYIESGSAVDAEGLTVGDNHPSSSGDGTVNIQGLGSSLNLRNSSTLTIGTVLNTGIHQVNVYSGGNLNTSYGMTRINPTGTMNISGGTLTLQGDLVIDGGSLNYASGHISILPDRTIAIRNGGELLLNNFAFPSGFGLVNNDVVLESGGNWIQTGAAALDIDYPSLVSISLDGGGANMRVDGPLNLRGGMTISPGGTLRLGGSVTIDGGTMSPMGGEVLFTTSGQTITLRNSGQFNQPTFVPGAPLDLVNQDIILESGGSWTQSGSLGVDDASSVSIDHPDSSMAIYGPLRLGGLMTITGGRFQSASTSTSEITSTGRVVQGSGEFNLSGDLMIDGGRFEQVAGTFIMQPLTTLNVFNNGSLGLGSGTTFNQMSIVVRDGGDITSTANINMTNMTLDVNGSGSTVTTAGSSLWNSGVVTFRGNAAGTLGNVSISNLPSSLSTLTVDTGAQVSMSRLEMAAASSPGASATVFLKGAGSSLNVGSLVVGSSESSVALLDVRTGTSLTVSQTTNLQRTGRIQIVGGTVSLGDVVPNGGLIVFDSGSLSMNNLTVGAGQPLGSNVSLTSAHDLTVNDELKIGFDGTLSLNNTTVDTGGALMLPGARLTGNSNATVTGAFSAGFGTRITVSSGNLILGKNSALNGFYSNGETVVNRYTLTIKDANDAVLDSGALMSLGGTTNPGTVSAANGLTLDFGGNISGFGTISTPNDSMRPFINNGHIIGRSAAQPLTLTGYVKGVGTLANVVVTGTLAPGLSPTILHVDGSLSLASGSSLEIEVGGATPGTQYDQVLVSGVAGINGQLTVELDDGFTPGAAQTFNILAATSATGQFTNVVCGRVATNGGTFEVQYSGSGVTLRNFRPSAGIGADFNFDGRVDDLDLDILAVNLQVGSIDPIFDLNGDSLVNRLDIDHIVTDVLGTFYGDANLNCAVSLGDLTILAANFDQPGGWAQGDFTGNGIVSLGDLTLMAQYYGFGESLAGLADGGAASLQGAAVPLPAAMWPGAALLGVAALRRRRGRQR